MKFTKRHEKFLRIGKAKSGGKSAGILMNHLLQTPNKANVSSKSARQMNNLVVMNTRAMAGFFSAFRFKR